MLPKKKLSLSDFLVGFDKKSISSKLEQFGICESFTYSLDNFYDELKTHCGYFVINEVRYDYLMASSANLYFYSMLNESVNDQFLIFYDPIIDIKKRSNNEYTVFYYPNVVLSIRLEEYHEQEITRITI